MTDLSQLYTIIVVCYFGVAFGVISDVGRLVYCLCVGSQKLANTTVCESKTSKNTPKTHKKPSWRAIKRVFARTATITLRSILDIIVCVSGFALFTLSLHKCSYGAFRLYFVVLFFVGFALEKVSVGFFVAKIIRKRYNGIGWKGPKECQKENSRQ